MDTIIEVTDQIHEANAKKPGAKQVRKKNVVQLIKKAYLQEENVDKTSNNARPRQDQNTNAEYNPIGTNEQEWETIIVVYGEWSEKIRSLREAIVIARRLINDYKEQQEVLNMMSAIWNDVTDTSARTLLTAILWARTQPRLGLTEYKESAEKEGTIMKTEFKLNKVGWQILTLEEVITAILEGKLDTKINSDYQGVYKPSANTELKANIDE